MRIAVVPAGPAEGEHALLPGNKAPRNPFRVGWPRLPSPTRTRTKLAEEGTNSKPSLRHPDPWKLGGPADDPSPALKGTLSPSDGALPLVGECQEGRRGFSLALSDGERAGVRGFPWGWRGPPHPGPLLPRREAREKLTPEYGSFFLGPNPAVVPNPPTRPTVAI